MYPDGRDESGSVRGVTRMRHGDQLARIYARTRPTPRRQGLQGPLRRSSDFSGRFTVSVARNDSAGNVGERRRTSATRTARTARQGCFKIHPTDNGGFPPPL